MGIFFRERYNKKTGSNRVDKDKRQLLYRNERDVQYIFDIRGIL